MMFLAAVGVPQDIPGGGFFDGKICMLPVAERTIAVRNSTHRPRGTELWKPTSMTSEEYLHFFTKEGGVFEKIREKMHWMKDFTIRIQQDNATPHVGKDNTFLLHCGGYKDGWNMEFIQQPANSPDLNVLDLCLFHSMQRNADHIRGSVKTLDQLHDSVMQCWNDYKWEKLQCSYAVMCQVRREILRHEGGNQYKLPHTGVRKRQAAHQNHEGEEDNDVPDVIDLFVHRDVRLEGLNAVDKLMNGAQGLLQANIEESDDEDEGGGN